MKNLKDILIEKLNIKDIDLSKSPKLIPYEDYENTVRSKFYELKFSKTPSIEYQDKQKMEQYRKKGSNPTRLVNSIKDNNKLVRRWLAAVFMEWDDAIKVFGNEIDKRLSEKGITLNFLHSYIVWCHKQYAKYKQYGVAYDNYLNLYNIKY